MVSICNLSNSVAKHLFFANNIVIGIPHLNGKIIVQGVFVLFLPRGRCTVEENDSR